MEHKTFDVYGSTVQWAEKHSIKLWAMPETSSTNTIAKEDEAEKTIPVLHAGAAVSQPSLYLAARQTQGRGRGENKWETPPASALLSSWSFAMTAAPQPVLTPQVGLALFEAARKTWPSVDFNLKAPNDLYIAKLKVAGLLIETVDWGHARRAVVGLGLNVATHPAQVATSTSLAEALHENFIEESDWQNFLTSFRENLQTAMAEGQRSVLNADVRARLKDALNRHPLLKEPLLEVDERGQLITATKTIYWNEL